MTRIVLSHEELDAARNLLDSGFPRQAVSRAYYAAFYAARAALEAAGEPSLKTHSGMRSRFGDLAPTVTVWRHPTRGAVGSLELVTPDIGRSFYRAVTTLDALALIEEPPPAGAEGGSRGGTVYRTTGDSHSRARRL